jgi:hypothetical protein
MAYVTDQLDACIGLMATRLRLSLSPMNEARLAADIAAEGETATDTAARLLESANGLMMLARLMASAALRIKAQIEADTVDHVIAKVAAEEGDSLTRARAH